jgi:hypothetical protein
MERAHKGSWKGNKLEKEQAGRKPGRQKPEKGKT